MINQETYEAYKRIRQEHPRISALSAWHYVKHERKQASYPTLEWEDKYYKRHAQTIIDGFTVHITIEDDWDHNWLDGRGKFSDNFVLGAIFNPRSTYDRNTYRCFIPDTTEQQHYDGLIKLGYGKQEARKMARSYVQEDMKIASDPEKAGYYAALITVKAFKNGVELGWDTLGGIEMKIGEDESYLIDCVWDCIHEAVSEAKEKLTELRAMEWE